MATNLDQFKSALFEFNVLDRKGVHHEFVSGMHGQKIDFDTIPEGHPLIETWAEAVAEKFRELYEIQYIGRTAIMSVADGTNRILPHVARQLDHSVIELYTQKPEAGSKKVILTQKARRIISNSQLDLVVAIEDVGTTGSTIATAVLCARKEGVQRVEAITTWQRRERLERLDHIGVPYDAVIFDPLPTYTPEECRTIGYCAMKPPWELIEHSPSQ